MKEKLFTISSGLIIGVVMTAVMTFTGTTQVAYSEGDDGVAFWNKVVAYSDSFSWSDVFDANDGLDLYVLIYKKTTEYPEKDALRDLALNYGMTTDEAKAALDGSITPIFNSPDRNGLVLSQADALAIVKEMQTDYNSLKELYDIEQEVDMAIKPSELFANGDLSDSGFDLISDLDRIEQILFFNETATTVGGDFAGALDSPNNVVERDEVFADYVASETPVAVDRLSLKPGDEPSAVVQLGGAELPVEILDQDICVLDDPTKEALDQYEQEQAEADVLARAAGLGGDADAADAVADLVGLGDAPEDGNELDDPDLKPAPPGNWGSAWCPGLDEGGGGAVDNFSEDQVGKFLSGFESLGGSSPAPLFAGGSARADNQYVQANAAVCFSLQLVRQTLSSYNPGDSCIQCEIEKINVLMEKTLAHTLIPNKATGNLLESAKCKQTGGALLNLQLITIWNPIPTPANDELIFGKNIFEEWNDFTKRYQPLILKEIQFSEDGSEEFILGHAPGGSSQIDILNQVENTSNAYAAQAEQQVKTYLNGDSGTNQALYLRNVLAEMQQMNSFFKSFRDTYEKINQDAIAKIKAKPNIQ